LKLLEPVYQRPSDLVLAVTRQELTCPLTFLASRSIERGPWRFTFQIIGESHLVRVEQDGRLAWQEVLACVTLPPVGLLHHHRFASLTTHRWRFDNYDTRVRFAKRLPLAGSIDDEIRVEFPAMYGQMPFTSIGWRITSGSTKWQTVHVYPGTNEVIYVCSESTFTVK
jgi:hypothetical protein